ncbi:MAG: PEP-CTERM sorting domain-containing protein [Armatimonadetes bacterium]|nr:PEP-CTERM sorting domain-containing protein [Armatimonadota bacterium]
MKNLKLSFAVIAAVSVTSAFATGDPNIKKFRTEGDAACFVDCRSEVFTAVGRIGDRAAQCNTPGSTWELGLGLHVGTPLVKRDYSWNKCAPSNFSVKYTASTKKVTFQVGGEVLNYTIQSDKKIDGLIIKGWAGNCASVKLDTLSLNNVNKAFTVQAANGGRDFLAIRGLDSSKNWEFAGKATICWSGNQTPDSTGFSVKGCEAVPEPTSMAALGLGVAGLIKRRRAAKKA